MIVARIEPETELKVLEVRAELERLLTRCALQRATDRHQMQLLIIVQPLHHEVREENLRVDTLLRLPRCRGRSRRSSRRPCIRSVLPAAQRDFRARQPRCS
jgi:hypothetical protein